MPANESQHEPAPEPRSSEWDQAAPTGMADPVNRAAALTWTLGGIEIVLFGAMVVSAVALTMVSEDRWLSLAEQSGVAAGEAEGMRGALLPMAMMLLVLGLAPAAALLGLGWAVRRRRATPTYAAQLLALTQTLVFGILALVEMVGAMLSGNPSRVSLIVIVMGSLVALMAYTCKVLGDARASMAAAASASDRSGDSP